MFAAGSVFVKSGLQKVREVVNEHMHSTSGGQKSPRIGGFDVLLIPFCAQ